MENPSTSQMSGLHMYRERGSFRRHEIPGDFMRDSSDVVASGIEMRHLTPSRLPRYKESGGNYHEPARMWRLTNVGQNDEQTINRHAQKIVNKLEEEDDLMNDTPLSQQLRLETIRDLPQSITLKRCVYTKLSKSVSQKSKRKPISWSKSLKYRLSLWVSKRKLDFHNLPVFELWHDSLKNIEGNFGSGYASYFKFLRWTFVMTVFVTIPALGFIVVPQIWLDLSKNQSDSRRNFNFKDVLTGDGYLENSVLFYGHYTNSVINLIPNMFFSMPITYLVTNVILYLVVFIVLSVSVAQSYRRSFIETEGGFTNVYAHKIFSGWDFGIATKDASQLKKSAIYRELKELLSESFREKPKLSLVQKIGNFGSKIVINLAITIVLSLIGYGLWKLLETFGSEKHNNNVFVTPVIINIILMVLPPFFNYISKYENYENPRTAIYITLMRTFMLGLVIVGVVMAYWMIKANTKPDDECWEVALTQEIYRLLIFDFIFSVIVSSFIEIIWFYIQKTRRHAEVTKEFDIAHHTLSIIYNQALFWVGFLFSPLLPVIISIKMFIIWYIRYLVVIRFYKPPKRTWRAAQTTTWFLILTFISMFVVIALHGYTLTSMKVSKTCGPFHDHVYIYEMITGKVEDLKKYSATWNVILYLTKPWIVSLFIVSFGVWVYYAKEQAVAQRGKVEMLREMLVWEAKDKKFLLDQINSHTNGRMKVNLGSHRQNDPILTLPGATSPRDSISSNF